MITWIIFGLIILACILIIYRAYKNRNQGCSGCGSCDTKCMINFKQYLKDRQNDKK